MELHLNILFFTCQNIPFKEIIKRFLFRDVFIITTLTEQYIDIFITEDKKAEL